MQINNSLSLKKFYLLYVKQKLEDKFPDDKLWKFGPEQCQKWRKVNKLRCIFERESVKYANDEDISRNKEKKRIHNCSQIFGWRICWTVMPF